MSSLVPRDIVKLLEANGFKFERQTKHHIFKHPSGEIVSVSGTPRTPGLEIKRVKRDIKRAKRKMQERGWGQPEQWLP